MIIRRSIKRWIIQCIIKIGQAICFLGTVFILLVILAVDSIENLMVLFISIILFIVVPLIGYKSMFYDWV